MQQNSLWFGSGISHIKQRTGCIGLKEVHDRKAEEGDIVGGVAATVVVGTKVDIKVKPWVVSILYARGKLCHKVLTGIEYAANTWRKCIGKLAHLEDVEIWPYLQVHRSVPPARSAKAGLTYISPQAEDIPLAAYFY